VTVTINGQTKSVLTAAMIFASGPTFVSPEPIEHVVIATPAEVLVAPADGATLFISYKKYVEPAKSLTPTPTPTATPTATPTPPATPTPTPTPTSIMLVAPVVEATFLFDPAGDSPIPTPIPKATSAAR
jgi:hypothetical protein